MAGVCLSGVVKVVWLETVEEVKLDPCAQPLFHQITVCLATLLTL